jgi:hypothetical protein
MQHVRFTLFAFAIAVALFLGMLVFLELGRRVGVRLTEQRGPGARAGVGVVDTAVYSLLALLIGFTFSGATSRFDNRRQLVIKEAEAISIAWMRVDVLPTDKREPIRAGFRSYLDALLTAYANPAGSQEESRARAEAKRVQEDLWARSVAECTVESGEKARMLLLPALNEMFGAAERERLTGRLHPPPFIYVLLGLTALAASLFGGYSISSGTTRNWFHVVGFAATIALAVYVILELEFPRNGLVRMDRIDSTLVELRATMK